MRDLSPTRPSYSQASLTAALRHVVLGTGAYPGTSPEETFANPFPSRLPWLEALAVTILRRALAGDVDMIRQVWQRLDGRVPTVTELTGEIDHRHVHIYLPERGPLLGPTSPDPPAPQLEPTREPATGDQS